MKKGPMTQQIRPVRQGRLAATVLAAFFCLGASPAGAEDGYPTRPVELIVPWGTGGGADQMARKTADLMAGVIKTSVPVANIPGATGSVGLAKLLAGPADGYSVGVLTGETYALLAYYPPRWKFSDVTPVAIMMRQPSGFFVAGNSRFKNWADFEKEAKARPYALKIAIAGHGSPDDITLNYFKAKGIDLTALSFPNPEERYAAVLKGEVDAMYEQAGDLKALIDSRQVRPIVFFTAQRVPEFRDVPAAKELGYDFGIPQFRAIVVKAGTDPQKVARLSDALGKIAASPEFKAYLKEQYASEDSYLPGQQALDFMQKELDVMKKVMATAYMPGQFIIQSEEVEKYIEPF